MISFNNYIDWFDLYSKMPVWAQNIACSLAGLRMKSKRYNITFISALKLLIETEWWTIEQQKEYQNEQLRMIINHAYETVPYYQEIFKSNKLKPSDIKSSNDLYKLPLLEKTTVRNRFNDLQSRAWDKSRIEHGHTGGTTGTSLKLIYDTDTQPWQWAVWWRHRKRFGLKINDPFIVFAGRNVVPLNAMNPPVWRRNIPMHQTYISVHHLTKKNMEIVADYLCNRKVIYYSGYPSAIYLVASYFLRNNITLPYPPRVVVTGAETLLPYQREVISKAFNTEVTDQYGASEHCGNISECEHHLYHVDMEFGIIEFIHKEGFPSNICNIICTGFHNKAMPMIRYNIGDVATLANKACQCGRQSPVIERIDGRIESYIITPEGRQLGRLDFLFKDTQNIEEAQLVQDNVKSVTIKIVRSPEYTAKDEQSLLKNIKRYLGNEIEIKIEYIKVIQREANGKLRQIISHVSSELHKH